MPAIDFNNPFVIAAVILVVVLLADLLLTGGGMMSSAACGATAMLGSPIGWLGLLLMLLVVLIALLVAGWLPLPGASPTPG